MGAKTCRIPSIHAQGSLQLPIPLPQVNRHFRPFIRSDQHRNRLQPVPTKSHHLAGHQRLEPPNPLLHRSTRHLRNLPLPAHRLGLPAHPGFAAALVVVRELLHHVGLAALRLLPATT